MRKLNMIIFFTIFFAVYGLVNLYIFLHGWNALPAGPGRAVYLAGFTVLSLAFIAGRILERNAPSSLSDTLVWTGSFWLAAMLYFFLFVIVLDLVRVLNFFVPLYPSYVQTHYVGVKQGILAGATLAVAIVLAAGFLNARMPRIERLTVVIPKHVDGASSMTIVAASDIHLGTIIGRSRLEKTVQTINSLDPDLVLLPGDIVDEDLGPVLRGNLGEMLRNLRSRNGVLAVTGNHEYIGGAEEACAYLRDHGVTVLRDSVARLTNGVYIIGREDRSISQFAGKKRRPLEELVRGVDLRSPVIMMDHQPFHLEEAVDNGVDLQLSGHTHHGQLWPLNYITQAVYELSWGYIRKGSTHFYVSSGVGTWGPPVRTGNRPEIVHITLQFQNSSGASGGMPVSRSEIAAFPQQPFPL